MFSLSYEGVLALVGVFRGVVKNKRKHCGTCSMTSLVNGKFLSNMKVLDCCNTNRDNVILKQLLQGKQSF